MHIDTHPAPAPVRLPLYRQLYVQVLIAITLGALLGHFEPAFAEQLKPLGDGFIKLVKMIIAPVIFLTIVTGVAGMTQLSTVGRVFGKAMAYFLFFSTLALVIGMVVAHVVQPGAGMNINPAELDVAAVNDYAQKAHDLTLTGFLLDIIPSTMVGAFASGNILQVLFIAVLFGIALAMVGDRGKPVLGFLEALTLPVFKLVHILMKAAPVGAFGAIAFTIGKYGLESLVNLAWLVGTFYVSSLLFVLIVLGAVARLCGFSVIKLARYLKAELLLVLGTSSSESALPSLMEKMEKAGCEKSVVGLVVPTGYSFNLDGTNIYMTLAALFIAQATNTELTLWQQITLLLVAMLSSKGAAGVTGAGFITLAATLSVVPTVPVAGMALILGVDRFMSECRSLTNFIGNAVATVVVSRWENALDRDKLQRALDGDRQPDPLPELEAEPSFSTD
ncbi:dicarboxylate/amino acid:cation symporter [Pseudoxanthomonas wuyuanensis]|uniref:C4-dicarboxylate transport protein n=1 Tax=Pseudoxanthomonas wuyuanensis TaxID=1073196 RepID=A0A286DAH8_9GAMM|nr:dicarboxylate/amino acid:cation symporter [Pseudoxanthomonas wuyuanensis]KAF1720576.1 dicarboxylate/amino acid:cation symporter [Pseudoxanthomonas wuyuanensis]SOD55650.1 aerobic C4-dicarboxylate transport protein [Pseudoxanthomonas wuyuanensis]